MGSIYYDRTLETAVSKASRQFKVVLVTGPRQVGKTALLRHLCGKTRTYVTFDDLAVRSLARDDPALFLQRFRPPLLIDEIQYAPGTLHPVEIKLGATPKSDWVAAFGSLGRLKREVGEGGVVCLAPESLPLSATAQAIPVGWL